MNVNLQRDLVIRKRDLGRPRATQQGRRYGFAWLDRRDRGQTLQTTFSMNLPPQGRALPFEQWAKVLVVALRELLPEIRATRKGGVVTLRYRNSERVVTITEDAGTYWIKTTDAGASMAMLCDSERHDEHTARTFARTIAGGFDDALSRP